MEETEEEPLAPAPQAALDAELALIERDEEAGQEELPTPGLELPADEETGLARLFDDGLTAYEREEWPKARELLAEVVSRRPDYVRDGRKASSLLAEAKKRLAPPRRRLPRWGWALGGLAALALVVYVAVMSQRGVERIAIEVTNTPRGGGQPGISESGIPFTLVQVILVTGNDGTVDNPVLELYGTFDDSPLQQVVLDLPNDLRPGQVDTYTFIVPVDFCAITGYTLRKPAGPQGDDSWTLDEIYLSLNGVEVFFDRAVGDFSPITSDSFPPNGGWSETEEYKRRCTP